MNKTGINMGGVKKNNRAQILKLINQAGPISKKDIAENLGLTPAAVTLLCSELLEQGILVERGILPGEAGKAGRKKVSIDINEDYGYIYSINIDSENTCVSICNPKGESCILRTIATDNTVSPKVFLKKITVLCEKLRERVGLSEEQILGAGIGVPGDVDTENGIALNAYGVWSERVEVGRILSEMIHRPVAVENNVNEYATAELLFGKGRESNSFLLVKWGPGVGSAIIYNREVYEGEQTRTAELGHMIVKPNGRKCACGKNGCLEAYLSYKTLSNTIGSFEMAKLEEHIKALEGEKKNIWDEAVSMFAQNIVNAAMLLGIHEIVLSGQMFAGKTVCDAVIRAAETMAGEDGNLTVSQSKLIVEEGSIGPAAYFIQKQCIQF